MSLKQDKPIRFSTWYVYDPVKKSTYVLKEILVAGEHKHIPAIAESSRYKKTIYMKVFSKRMWSEEMNKDMLIVKRIVLSDKIFGLGVGSIDEEKLKKYGL